MSWLPLIDRPATTPLTVACAVVVAGWLLHWWALWSTRPKRVTPVGATRPAPLSNGAIERPAVVALLTNDYELPAGAITATALDLAARGWIRLAAANGELIVVTRPVAASLDPLLPFEQQVLNHMRARAFNDITSANTLAASRDRLDVNWRSRLARSVAASSRELGLSRPRYAPQQWAPPVAAVGIAVLALILSWRGATDVAIADSWLARAVWLVALAGAIALGVATGRRIGFAAQLPTELGASRTAAWLGYRQRLRDRIPTHASVLGAPDQQRALALAVGMGVATHVHQELPVAPDDPRRAWSEAGGTAHVVRVRYPFRPGYGQHPWKVLATGVVAGLVLLWVRAYLRKIADGEALQSLLDKSPGQVDLFHDLAAVLATICILPLIAAAWAALAGLVDSLATRERVGAVVRTRHPDEVLPRVVASVLKPFAHRGGFTTYLAVDDGAHRSVTAWIASERSAAPEGAQARVRVTPLLGYVRSSEPIGTSTR